MSAYRLALLSKLRGDQVPSALPQQSLDRQAKVSSHLLVGCQDNTVGVGKHGRHTHGVNQDSEVCVLLGHGQPSACLIDRPMRRRARSMLTTFTRTRSPTRTTCDGCSTNRLASWLT